MKEQVLLYIISGLSTLLLFAVGIVGYFLKNLISKIDTMQTSVYELNGKVGNITSEMGFVKAEIKILKERLDKHEDESILVRDRLKALEVYMAIEEK